MDGGSAALQQLIFFALLIVVLYFLAIRPQRKRAQALVEVRTGLHPGSRVMTAGGMHGTVTEIDGDTVLIEIAPGVPVRFTSAAVVRVLPDPDAAEPPADGPAA